MGLFKGSFFAFTFLAISMPAWAQTGEVSTEYCRGSVCYLTSQSDNGSEKFTFTEETAKTLDIDLEKVAETGLNVEIVSSEEYEATLDAQQPKRVMYPVFPETKIYRRVFTFDMQCSLGIAGGAGMGGLEGAAFGPLGVALGGLIGGAAGAATTCFS